MLDKAKSGKLDGRDFRMAMDAVTEGRVESGDLYTALHVVGLAGSRAHAEAVGKYLHVPADPMLSRLALQILCDYWGMTSEFLPELRAFVAGVEWDVDGDVRDMAVSVAGNHLREAEGPSELARMIMAIAEDESEFSLTRESALRALARSLGDSLVDPSSPAVRVRVDTPLAADVLERAVAKWSRS
ncbi:hypothetical protein ACFH04_03205 [Streptomyces noboritoensis]|uniref:EF-hand domain-containing protein n=1 Tax=Streptomyces noboritoensis TaxID=67337 RepID=A0ABV6TAE3_9ACTN